MTPKQEYEVVNVSSLEDVGSIASGRDVHGID